MQELLPGEASKSARGQEEDALPRLRLRSGGRTFLRLVASAALGVLASLAFPPVGAWPLAAVGLVPLLLLWRGTGPARGFLLGLVFGLGFFGATLYWIYLFGFGAWIALTLVSAASIGLVGLLRPAVVRTGRPLLSAFAIAALWVALDWFRSVWPLGGFSWGAFGTSQVDNTATIRLATVTGVWGVTFVVVAANALVAEAIAAGGGWRRSLGRVGLAAGLMLAPVLIPFATANGAEVRIASIQVDVRQAGSGSTGQEDLAVAALNVAEHERLAAEVAAGERRRPDLVVWGEGALDPQATQDPATMEAVSRAVAGLGVPTAIGAVVRDPDGSEHTSVLLLDSTGEQTDRYDKVHLVPFGEFVPFRDRLSWFEAIEQIPVDREPGPEVRDFHVSGAGAFGTPICFENGFPSLTRSFVQDGAEFLVVNVNNASYEETAASEQHLQMSRMRAVENGRWVVNAAVSGISAFVDPTGRVVADTDLFETTVLEGAVRRSEARTPYVALGDWVPWVSLGMVVVLIALPRRRPRVREAPAVLGPGFRTLVILPTYEERETIERVVRGVLDRPERPEVLVIDDASPDGTPELVRDMMASEPRLRLQERSGKQGLASAYLLGFQIGLREGYDLVVEMDSDLSHDPRELSGLLQAASAGSDLVVGSRYVTGGSVTNWSRSRAALSRAGNSYARFMLGLKAHDATSGYRVYRRALLQDLLRSGIASEGYGFQIELVMRSWDSGFTVSELPITFREREHGKSKISRRIVVEALWLVTRWGLRRRFRPDEPDPR